MKKVVNVYWTDYIAYVDDDDPWIVEYDDGSKEEHLKYSELSDEAKKFIDEDEEE